MHHLFPPCAIAATPRAWKSSTGSMRFRDLGEARSTLESAKAPCLAIPASTRGNPIRAEIFRAPTWLVGWHGP